MTRRVLAALAVSTLLAAPGLAADAPSKVVEKDVPLAAGGRLSVETYKGRVDVRAWDRPEVSVRAVVTPDGTCEDAAELVERTQVRIEGGGREVRVVSDYEDLPKVRFDFRSDCGSRPFVEYDIRMPAGASLAVKDYKSRVSVEGVAGGVAVDSYKGTMRLRGLSGPLEIETYKGDARAELDRVTGDVRLETYKGEIELLVPRASRLDLREEVGRRGRLEAHLEDAGSGPRVSVETYKGTILLREKR
jgi:hypothetical protein